MFSDPPFFAHAIYIPGLLEEVLSSLLYLSLRFQQRRHVCFDKILSTNLRELKFSLNELESFQP